MKKTLIPCIISFILLFIVVSVFAQGEEPFENPTYTEKFIEQQERMLENLDTLFPRTLLKETYDYSQAPEVIQKEGFSFSSQNKSGKRELTITAYQVSQTQDYNLGWSLFNRTGSYENFYLNIEGQFIEQDDSNSGFWWFEYSNREIVGDDKGSSVIIEFPYEIYSYIEKPSKPVYTKLYDLTEYENDNKPHILEVIRLSGYTSIFIDRHFILGFEDGFSGKFSHLYGAGIYAGGEYTTIGFDNFIIRRQ